MRKAISVDGFLRLVYPREEFTPAKAGAGMTLNEIYPLRTALKPTLGKISDAYGTLRARRDTQIVPLGDLSY